MKQNLRSGASRQLRTPIYPRVPVQSACLLFVMNFQGKTLRRSSNCCGKCPFVFRRASYSPIEYFDLVSASVRRTRERRNCFVRNFCVANSREKIFSNSRRLPRSTQYLEGNTTVQAVHDRFSLLRSIHLAIWIFISVYPIFLCSMGVCGLRWEIKGLSNLRAT